MVRPTSNVNRHRLLAFVTLALTLALAVSLGVGHGQAAEGEQPPVLWTVGQNCGDPVKVEAGECAKAGETPDGDTFVETLQPAGVATNGATGYVYIADSGNHRIVELTAWGQFVKAWGWGVRDGSPEAQVCTAATGCRTGMEGAEAGQFDTPTGIAVDSLGDVYVWEYENLRVQKFDSDGHFLLMFGGDVDKGPVHPGNICTAAFIADGDSCGKGTSGTASGQFSAITDYLTGGNPLAIGQDDEVLVGDKDRIQRFDSKGVYQGELTLPEEGFARALTADPESNSVYYASAFNQVLSPPQFKTWPVYRLDADTGQTLGTLRTQAPTALAADREGNVYVFEHRGNYDGSDPESEHGMRIAKFDAGGNRVAIFADEVTRDNGRTDYDGSIGIATGAACFSSGTGVYVANTNWGAFGSPSTFIRAYGVPDKTDLCPPPPGAPRIESEYALSVDADGALLGADINPRFWPDATYRVEYATAGCIEDEGWEAGCVTRQPSGTGSKLGGGVTSTAIRAPGTFLSGLEPDTAYRYRFVAESGGGGPTAGGGQGFQTPPLPAAPNTNCPNQVLRAGASAMLPDCRAFELVSPLDKAGGDILARLIAIPYVGRHDQSSTTGDALAYSSYRSFGEAEGAPFSSEYLARRDPGSGWSSENLSPPQEGPPFFSLLNIDVPFRAFSPDLETGWLQTNFEPVLGPGGVAGWTNLYRRDNSTGTYRGCTNAEPRLPSTSQLSELQGVSEDQSLGLFRTMNQLTDDALETTASYQLYACSFGQSGGAQVRLVSILPNGKPSQAGSNLGGPANAPFAEDQGRTGTVANAVSADGSRVFWTASLDFGPGSLYVRFNPASPPTATGKCDESEPEAACTALISSGRARYFSAAKDGSRVIYGKEDGKGGESLFEYTVDTAETHLIAEKSLGLLGAGDDASRVYFLSPQALDAGAVEGDRNLYLYESGGDVAFLAALNGETAGGKWKPVPYNVEPIWHAARVSPDGRSLAFMSDSPALARSTAGYDNTDQETRLPASEVYRYRSGGEVVCVSCNRTGARPRGRAVQFAMLKSPGDRLIAASYLQPWENGRYGPRGLSDDGSRIYFDSFEPLVAEDTNGKADVYQWEQAGSGDCTVGTPAFVPASGGCVTLISSGKSSSDSEFVDASPDGRDVFIRTAASLVSFDPGQVDIYDARVGGGFPPPAPPPAACEGEACQGPYAPPADPSPASSTFSGAGNVVAKPAAKKHRRHKQRKRKKKRHGKAKKNRHSHNRGASR